MQRWENLLQTGCKALVFWMGLNFDLEPYIFQMVNTAQAQKRKLEIDRMIIALVDDDRRLQFFDETITLATKLSLRHHHQLRPRRINLERVLPISMSQNVRNDNHAIFS